jgi:hypothetical protein
MSLDLVSREDHELKASFYIHASHDAGTPLLGKMISISFFRSDMRGFHLTPYRGSLTR